MSRSPRSLASYLPLFASLFACAPHGADRTEVRDVPPVLEPAPPSLPVPSVGPVPAPEGARCFASPVDHVLPFHPADAELGDVDGDGDLDMVVLGWSEPHMRTMANDGAGGFVELARPHNEAETLDITLAHLDQDGWIDMISVHPRDGEVHVRRGDGRGDFGDSRVVALGRQVFEATAADFDADGVLDLLVTHLRHVAVLRGDARGGFVALPRVKVGQAPSYAFVADVDLDRRRELVLASNDDGGIEVVSFQGTQLGRVRHVACGEGPIALGMGDFDGDARPDLVTANMHSDDVCVFGGTERGFVVRQRIELPFDALAVLDFDRDGIDDVAFGHDLQLTLYTGQADGLFESESLAAGHGPRRALARDVDRDGLDDVVLLNGKGMSSTYDDEGNRVPLRPLDASFTVVRGKACERVEP